MKRKSNDFIEGLISNKKDGLYDYSKEEIKNGIDKLNKKIEVEINKNEQNKYKGGN